MAEVGEWVDLAISVVTLIAVLVAALWAYTRYALERGVLPAVQFAIEASRLGAVGERVLIEVLVHLKNVGPATLVAHNIRMDVLYALQGDDSRIGDSEVGPLFGRAVFLHSLKHDLLRGADRASGRGSAPERPAPPPPTEHSLTGGDPRVAGSEHRSKGPARDETSRGIRLVKNDIFVQPGVDQSITFVTSVPDDCAFVLTWACFHYTRHLSPVQSAVFSFSRHLGLIHYSLKNLRAAHTAERVFDVRSRAQGTQAFHSAAGPH